MSVVNIASMCYKLSCLCISCSCCCLKVRSNCARGFPVGREMVGFWVLRAVPECYCLLERDASQSNTHVKPTMKMGWAVCPETSLLYAVRSVFGTSEREP